MNRTALANRTARAVAIQNRYNPSAPYRVVTSAGLALTHVNSRDAARKEKAYFAKIGWNDLTIQKRQQDGSYVAIR